MGGLFSWHKRRASSLWVQIPWEVGQVFVDVFRFVFIGWLLWLLDVVKVKSDWEQQKQTVGGA